MHIEAGAGLKVSTNLANYQLDGVRRGFVFAFEAKDLALTGLGTIDGSSDAFFDPQRMHDFRNLGFARRPCSAPTAALELLAAPARARLIATHLARGHRLNGRGLSAVRLGAELGQGL